MKKYVLVLTMMLIVSILQACGNEADSGSASTTEVPKEIRLDYATYSPLSLIIKKQGWAEEAFKEEGIDVTWTLSQGSNKALEFLTSKSLDFSSASGAASLISRSKKVPLQAIYEVQKSEGVALVTTNPDINSLADLKGKKVAATFGTDPQIFLLLALESAGLTSKDIEFLNLQHSDGYQALLKGDVDVWAGLDPITATAELESGARVFYANAAFVPPAVLNVHEAFAAKYPEHTKRVVALYDRAFEWYGQNPEEAVKIVAEEAQISEEVATLQLSRLSIEPKLDQAEVEAIAKIGAVLQTEGIIDQSINIEELSAQYVNPDYTKTLEK